MKHFQASQLSFSLREKIQSFKTNFFLSLGGRVCRRGSRCSHCFFLGWFTYFLLCVTGRGSRHHRGIEEEGSGSAADLRLCPDGGGSRRLPRGCPARSLAGRSFPRPIRGGPRLDEDHTAVRYHFRQWPTSNCIIWSNCQTGLSSSIEHPYTAT